MSKEKLVTLAELVKQHQEVKATKNVNEHLNCTKQGCHSPWS
jgi:5-bromo-4-chloroindolyl phosphate hydrolysis protein